MIPDRERSLSGNFETNPFHFQLVDLESLQMNREGSLVRATSMHLIGNFVRSYYNTLKALGFENGGNGTTVDNFRHHFSLVFKLTVDYHIQENKICPDLIGALLGLEI